MSRGLTLNEKCLQICCMETIVVTKTITMPFTPMKPQRGKKVRTKTDARALLKRIESGLWIVQPKLKGERACLAVVDKKVYIQDGEARWYDRPVANSQDFLRLPNQTLFDGEIHAGKFYPFECLAALGESYMLKPASEREILAFQFVKFLRHKWMFPRPGEKFVLERGKDYPNWEGVVLKEFRSIYVAGSASSAWLSKEWE